MTITIKRLWHGYATVRDYQAKEAYKNGEDLVLICEGRIMVVPHKDIMAGAINPTKFTSKHDGLPYYLIDYPFVPTIVQQQLL